MWRPGTPVHFLARRSYQWIPDARRSGKFGPPREFGKIASVRSLTLADIDGDGDQDVLATCRGMANQIYLNDGKARFGSGIPFGRKNDSTIDVAVGDVDQRGQDVGPADHRV